MKQRVERDENNTCNRDPEGKMSEMLRNKITFIFLCHYDRNEKKNAQGYVGAAFKGHVGKCRFDFCPHKTIIKKKPDKLMIVTEWVH